MDIKSFYKYKYGYVNVDPYNVYLTATGNWSETGQLSERKAGKSTKKTGKIVIIYLFLFAILMGILCLFLLGQKSILLRFGTLAGSIIAFLKLKDYFDTETGERFYIQKRKITAVSVDGTQLTIEFTSPEGSPDSIILYGIKGDTRQLKEELNRIRI